VYNDHSLWRHETAMRWRHKIIKDSNDEVVAYKCLSLCKEAL
jgi:hypothetical protein